MLVRYQKALTFITLSSLVVTTLFIAPGMAYDPFNAPRLLSLGAFCGASLVALFLGLKFGWVKHYKTPLSLVLIFIFFLTMTLLFTDAPFTQQFFGALGRNTGYIAYFALAVQLLVAAISATPKVFGSYVLVFLAISFVSSSYGFLQWAQLDPFPLDNPSNVSIGFFGNQNFQSAFTGIAISMALSIMISQNIIFKHRIILLVFIVFSLFQLSTANSTQGFMLVFGSIGLILFFRFVRYTKKIWWFSYLSVGLIVFVSVILGALNKGIFARYLYEESITFRGDYWRAGQQMTLENPFFGVGLDSYGDWYRRARTIEATLRRGPDVFSNSAHNLFIDLSSNGGFPLLMAYLLIIVLTIRSSIKVFKREIGYDWKFTSVFIAWVAFLTQSLISVNQLGLGIWGWTLTGLLIGYEINTRNSDKGPNQNSTQGTGLSGNVSLGETKTDWDIVLFSTFGLILGTVIALTPFRNSVELYSLVGEVNVSAVESLGTRDSINPEIAVILAANLEKDFEESALKIIRNTVKNYPDSYAAWKFFSNLRGATSQEIAQAQIQMKRLDPLNPELK